MKKNFIGFTIDLSNRAEIVKLPFGKKASDFVDPKKYGTHHSEYIRKFLLSEENFKIAAAAVDKGMKESLPKDIRDRCQVCLCESKNELDKECSKYYLQMEFTYNVVVVEYIRIVLKNKHIYQNKDIVFELTKEFFKCINFINGKGIMIFDLGRLQSYTLKLWLLSISQLLSDSDSFQRLTIINDTLDELNQKELENKIFHQDDCPCVLIQKNFFLNKQQYYKEELFIKEKSFLFPEIKSKIHNNHNRPTSSDIAYFAYYTSESKELVTKNTFPSKKAWKEISLRYKKDDTNIQKVYNKIYRDKEERLKLSRADNIEYVLEHMLEVFNESKIMAQNELNIAKLN